MISLAPVTSPFTRISPQPNTTPVATPGALVPSTSSRALVMDLTEAGRLASRAVEMLTTLPTDDNGFEHTKDLRIRIAKTSQAAQSRLERHFDSATLDPIVVSSLRTADAYLEDANWQLARKPSPDGRFNGVDVPGALRDATTAASLIADMLATAIGKPNVPGAPGVPTTPNVPTPPTAPTPPASPTPPTVPTPPTTPPSNPDGPDPDYPGDDEFPVDDGRGGSSGDS